MRNFVTCRRVVKELFVGYAESNPCQRGSIFVVTSAGASPLLMFAYLLVLYF